MTMTQKTLSVNAIKNGTVIDHIAAGQALKIIRLLKMTHHHKIATLGLNLPSETLQYKDLIKVEDWELTQDEANRVAILAPNATINIIRDYEVVKKFKVQIPSFIVNVISCLNPRCISNHERMYSYFHVKQRRKQVLLQCRYCNKIFSYQDIQNEV